MFFPRAPCLGSQEGLFGTDVTAFSFLHAPAQAGLRWCPNFMSVTVIKRLDQKQRRKEGFISVGSSRVPSIFEGKSRHTYMQIQTNEHTHACCIYPASILHIYIVYKELKIYIYIYGLAIKKTCCSVKDWFNNSLMAATSTLTPVPRNQTPSSDLYSHLYSHTHAHPRHTSLKLNEPPHTHTHTSGLPPNSCISWEKKHLSPAMATKETAHTLARHPRTFQHSQVCASVS